MRDERSAALVAAVTASTALAGVAAALGASAPDGSTMVGLLRGATVAAPLAAGIYTWGLPRYERMARLLLAVGVVSFATTLAESTDPALFTAGRSAGWLLEALLIYLVLVYPDGRLPARIDRLLMGASGLLLLVFYLPTLVLAPTFKVPSPYGSCVSDCPPNVLFALHQEPAFLEPLLRVPGSLATFALMVAVLVRVHHRMRATTPIMRRMMWPVLVVGAGRATAVGVAIVARSGVQDAWVVEIAVWGIAVATPAIAIAILAGLLRSRLSAEKGLRGLAGFMRTNLDVRTLRRALAEAFDDRSADIVFPEGRFSNRWIDVNGRPVPPPASDAGRGVRFVKGDDGVVVAAILCDEGVLVARPELVDAATALAAMAMDNQRLVAQAQTAASELRESRSRLVEHADQERRRIERDLHDGAQQRLVALRIELGVLEDLVESDPARGAERVRELEAMVDEALEELRALAHGVCPPLLADRGLAEALRAAAARSPLNTKLELNHVGRYPLGVERAVYFCVLEALQNAAKHAPDAGRVVVRLDAGDRSDLRFSVRDNGAGAPGGVLARGAGITNMRDRVAAIGGELRITSKPGIGTEVRGHIPIPKDALVTV